MAILRVASDGSGDYLTHTAALAAAISGVDEIHTTVAGTYAEVLNISKNVPFLNVSDGVVEIAPASGWAVDISGGTSDTPIVADLTGYTLRHTSGTLIVVRIGGASGAHNRFQAYRCKFLATTTTPQGIFHNGDIFGHGLRDCEVVGSFTYFLTCGGHIEESTINGLTFSGISVLLRTKTVGTSDHRNLKGSTTDRLYSHTTLATPINCTAGLLTTSQIWGFGNGTRLGTGGWKIEKSVFSGTSTAAFQAGSASVVFSGSFRNVEFLHFSSAGVTHAHTTPVPDMVDFCGVWDCPEVCSVVGSTGSHIVSDDPLFVDESGHDYHTETGSPLRDAGTVCVATEDPDGVPIPSGSAPDIGVYEHEYTASLPVLQSTDSSLRRATNFVGVAHVDPTYEVVPTDPTGALTDIRHLLMVWAGTDKYVPVSELPADIRDTQFPDCRGWMADPDTGNRLWLFERRPLSNAVDEECRLMLTADLAWLVTDGIAASYTVSVTHTGRRRDVQIEVKRLDGQLEKFGIADLWENRVI